DHPTVRSKEAMRLASLGVWCATNASSHSDNPRASANFASLAFGYHPNQEDRQQGQVKEKTHQCELLREIIGNPFRPVTIDPAWLAWNNRTSPQLAHGIDEERAFERLPILADALEEAGCTDADILSHCRQQGEHVRGCWVLDLLLGKT